MKQRFFRGYKSDDMLKFIALLSVNDKTLLFPFGYYMPRWLLMECGEEENAIGAK